MEMKHTLHDPNRTTSPITYNKTTIRRILSISQWGIHLHTTRTLINTRNKDFEVKYSYWDYVDSFTKVFYYQNPVNNYTWFIRISPEVLKTELPNWFLIWYDKCGLQLDALPEQIRNSFNDWHYAYSSLPVYKNISTSKSLVHFVIRFSIPWI